MTSEEWSKKEQQVSQTSQPLMPMLLPGTSGNVCVLDQEPDLAGEAAEDLEVIWAQGCQDVAVDQGALLSGNCTLPGSHASLHEDSHALPR